MNGVENTIRKHETEIRLIRESPDSSGTSRKKHIKRQKQTEIDAVTNNKNKC